MTALVKLAKALSVEVSELLEAQDEPETVQLNMLADGHPDTTFTLPKTLVDDLQADASKRGVPLEVILAASLELAYLRDDGVTASLDEIVARVAARYATMLK